MSSKSFKYNYSAIAIATCNILLQLFGKKPNSNFVLTTYNFPFIEDCSKNICENINEIISMKMNLSINKYYYGMSSDIIKRLIYLYNN